MTPRPPPPLDLTKELPHAAICRFSDWTELAWFPHLGDHGMDERASSLFVMSLGLGGESGELQEALADNNHMVIKKELGDVAYYWGRVSGFYDLDVNTMASDALAKVTGQETQETALRFGQWIGRSLEIIKKSVRDDGLDHHKLQEAMTNVLHFWAAICRLQNLDIQHVLQAAVDKITSRHTTGKLRGSDTSNGDRA